MLSNATLLMTMPGLSSVVVRVLVRMEAVPKLDGVATSSCNNWDNASRVSRLVATRCCILVRMTDDAAAAAIDRLRKASARVRKHEQERKELAEAIVNARRAGARPREIDEIAPYDRNHIGRILKEAGLTVPRAGKADN